MHATRLPVNRIVLAGLICTLLTARLAAISDHGPDGLLGLGPDQVQALDKGQVVVLSSGTDRQSSAIDAVLVFDRSLEDTWGILSRTEDQIHFLDNVVRSSVVSRQDDHSTVYFLVRVLFFSRQYRLVHTFNPILFHFDWTLDPGYENEILELNGSYQLYRFGPDRTLARYSTKVRAENVPEFLINFFVRNGIKNSLGLARQYVESGGTYRK